MMGMSAVEGTVLPGSLPVFEAPAKGKDKKAYCCCLLLQDGLQASRAGRRHIRDTD